MELVGVHNCNMLNCMVESYDRICIVGHDNIAISRCMCQVSHNSNAISISHAIIIVSRGRGGAQPP